MSTNSAGSSGDSSEGRRQAELELDELERRRHSNRHIIPAGLFHHHGPTVAAANSRSPHYQPQHQAREFEEEMDGADPLPAVAEPEGAVGLKNDNPIGLYGWRKRCLYFFVLLLVVVIITNLALTIWILVVLDFSQNGMGNLRILASGIRLEGTAEFLGPLYARNISADQNSTLLLHSQTSINLNIAGSGGSDIAMDNTTLNITAQQFQVMPPSSSSPALSISDDGTISVGASQMEVTGTLGMVLNGPLETGQISSHPNSDLNLESASGSLVMVGRGGVQIQDGPAFEGVEIMSNERLSISSSSQVLLDSETVRLRGIRRAQSSDGQQVYEVCACASGDLYLAPASADGAACSTHSSTACSTT